jgi:outer membrane protein
LQIKQANYEIENSSINLEQSKASVLPNLNAFAANYYNYGKTIDPFTNSFASEKVRSDRYGLQSNLTLFNGLQTYNSIQQNKLNLMASKYDAEKVISDISLYVASAYLQVLFALELQDIANQQILLTRSQVERTKKLVEAGSVAKGNLLTIESQAANEELAVVNAQNNLDNSYLNLAQLLELEDTKNFKIVRPTISSFDQNELQVGINSIYETALKNRPEIKSAELKLRSSRKGISIAKASLSPQLSMSGSYGSGYSGLSKRLVGDPIFGIEPTGYYTASNEAVLGPVLLNSFEKTPFSKQINDNVNKSFGINLSIPIFNGFQAKSSIAKAKIIASSAELKLELEQKNLYKTIQQAYTDAQASLKKLAASKKAVDALRESFKYSEQRFALGMLNSLDYNDSKIKLTKAESDFIQAKYDYVFKSNILNFYQGKPISF